MICRHHPARPCSLYLNKTDSCLLQNPAMIAKAQAEIDSVLEGRRPTLEDLKHLQWAIYPSFVVVWYRNLRFDFQRISQCGCKCFKCYNCQEWRVMSRWNLEQLHSRFKRGGTSYGYLLVVGRGFRYVRLIVAESLRLFPQPPLLIRRSLQPDTLPGAAMSHFICTDLSETLSGK